MTRLRPLLLCLACVGLLGLAAGAEETVTGRLYLSGSEPFTQVTLRTVTGETLVLGWANKHSDLLEHQDKPVRVVGQRVRGRTLPGGGSQFEAVTVVPLHLEGNVVKIQVEVHPNPEERYRELSCVIRPMKLGRWYQAEDEDPVSTGRVGKMAYELNEMKQSRLVPDLSPLIMQPFTDVSIHYLDGTVDRLRGGVVRNGCRIWQVYGAPGEPVRTFMSSDFTRAFLEVMEDADPEGWKPVADAFESEERQP